MGPAIVLTAFASGASDAYAILTVGVFASVMTGNLVLLGVSLVHGSASLAIHSGAALGGYVAGAAGGALVLRPARGATWPRRVRATLAAELVLLGVVAVVRAVAGPSPHDAVGMVPFAAAAMGLQSTVVREARLNTSTTYLTGTLTGLLTDLVRGRGLVAEGQTLLALGSALVGAAASAALVRFVPGVAPVLAVAAIGGTLVVVAAARRTVPPT